MMENLRSFLFSRRCNHRFLKTNWPHSVRAAFRRYLLAFAWASVCASAAAQAPASGFVVVSPSGKTYFHLTHAPEADVPLWAQWPGPDGQPVCCRKFTLQELTPASAQAGEGHAAMTASGREALSYEWRDQRGGVAGRPDDAGAHVPGRGRHQPADAIRPLPQRLVSGAGVRHSVAQPPMHAGRREIH